MCVFATDETATLILLSVCSNLNLESRADSRSSVPDDDPVIVKVSVLQVLLDLVIVLLC